MSIYTYDPILFIYQTTIPPENQLGEMPHSTTVPPLPYKCMLQSKWSPEENAWHYVEAPMQPGLIYNLLDEVMTYADMRKMEYPDISMYVDGIVKADDAQVAAYIQDCRDVKAKWPKTLEPTTMREFFVSMGTLRKT